MTDTYLADVSEFQHHVDWPTYAATNPVAIARVCYGTRHPDLEWAANKAGMRAHLRVRGFYQYVVASQDITAQANAFAALLGPLLPGEFAMCDVEEGAGDLTARAALWSSIVHGQVGGSEGEYSGSSFAAAHLRNFAGVRLVWVAAYQSNEPAVGHQLWQFTNRRQFPGIAAPCDASVFHGSIDQLAALISPNAPSPESPSRGDDDDMRRLIYTDPQGSWFLYDGYTKRPVRPGEPQTLADLGIVPASDVTAPKWVAADELASIPTNPAYPAA